MNTKRLALSALLAGPLLLLGTTSLHAAGCCLGAGDFGVEGQWERPKAGDKGGPKVVTFVHASFESSRPLYAELNKEFAKQWVKLTGYKLTVTGSHGGTEAQARSIEYGAEPDIISLDNPGTIDELAQKGSLPLNWRTRLPNNSAPFTTTVVFVVEKGNPKKIKDWSDLVAGDVKVITPDPQTSGRGRWNYLAAWGYARRAGGSDQAARDYVSQLYSHVPVLNSSGRGATDTFSRRGEGDVLLVWESEALDLVKQDGGKRKLEIVTPSTSILVEPPIAWLDGNLGKHENARVSISFAKFLYTPEAQHIVARYNYRPRLPEAAAKVKRPLPQLFTVDEQFGGWDVAVQSHFGTGKTAEQILRSADIAPLESLRVAAH